MEDPLDRDDERGEEPPERLDRAEEEDVRADLEDLAGMRTVFATQGVKGVVIACPDCGENHYYEWELLKDNLEVREEEYILWDYGKGYIDALADTGLEPDNRVEVTRCPWCETPFETFFQFCPRCGRALAPVRIYKELIDRGFEEREVRALLVRAGFEPF
jgi:hypothetical protein